MRRIESGIEAGTGPKRLMVWRLSVKALLRRILGSSRVLRRSSTSSP
jgi:hypothetical protein